MITISLDEIHTGKRATARVDGRTSCYFEGENGKELVEKALKKGAWMHSWLDAEGVHKYDAEFVRLNDAALRAMEESK